MTTESAVSTVIPSIDPPTPRWLKLVPLLTGLLAALGGFLTIRSTNLSNEAIYWSTQASIQQTKVSDAWAEYQANSIKARIVETERDSAPAAAAYIPKLDAESADYRQKQPGLAAEAKRHADEREHDQLGGRKRLTEKDTLGYAGMAAEIGVGLASIAALVKKPAAFYAGVACAIAGLAITGYAMIGDYIH